MNNVNPSIQANCTEAISPVNQAFNAPNHDFWGRSKAMFVEPSVFTPEYQILLRQLRKLRQERGLTQMEMGQRLGLVQPIISKCERGERRMDVMELRAYCNALEIHYLDFLRQIDLMIEKEIEHNV